MNNSLNITLETLFQNQFGVLPHSITPLPQGGSDRKYYRVVADSQSAIGAYNPDVEENRTFIYFTNHFKGLGFPVPQLYGVSDDETTYLLSDLGDHTLLHSLTCTVWESKSSQQIVELLKEILALLAKLQVEGAKRLDFSKCNSKSQFDMQSIMWDFNYFKYSFLKPSGIRFDETKLDDDFLAFTNVLLTQPATFFHYRDFQSRNVMLVDNKPYFIDYQGGRRGPLLYDVASFLYQARANFPQRVKDELLDFYLDKVGELTPIDKAESRLLFPIFALFRVIQTLGAYGYRGFFERRTHFLQSVPLAAKNLKPLLDQLNQTELKLPALEPILESIYNKYAEPTEQSEAFDGLTVEITSFSFKKGYPMENSEHGGGYVFDCRSLPNPGRLNQYKMLTGLDSPVIDYLNQHSAVGVFFERLISLVLETVSVYKSRGFSHLSVSFGCTGGQHRSVFMATRLAQVLEKVDGTRTIVKHREILR
jgi:aminoglycoside/choline kinase family phosphotransferase